jgi:hypothetical protein
LKIFLCSLLAAGALVAQTPEGDFFETRVRPILAKNCQMCHNNDRQSGGLNLASEAGFHKGADSGPVVLAGAPSQSRLLDVVGYNSDTKMPPSGKLGEGDIATLRKWIADGAFWPKEAAAVAPTSSGGRKITEADRQWWSFQPVKDPTPPTVKNTAWARTTLDRFILAKLEEKHLSPAPPAQKLTLLRRATYDLTGLPPTTSEIDAFLADNSPQAFAKVVDRLLASPQYGERWGRHWLDVARFADSTGMDEDHVYPNAWRYRDYVVNAFNADLPFNRFIEQQIAGDLLPAATPEERQKGITATGFLALGPKPLAQQDRIQMIYDVVDEQIDTTSRAFLGVTLACARCHDHKFDPLLTRDYYAMAGIYASTLDFRNLGRPGSVSYINNVPLDPAAYNAHLAHRWRTSAKMLEMEEAMSEDYAREGALRRPKIAAQLSAAWKVHATGAKLEDVAGESAKDVAAWLKWIDASDQKAREGYLKKWFHATAETIDAVSKEYEESFTKAATKWESTLANWRKNYAVEFAQDRDLPARPKPDAEANPFFAAAGFDKGPLALQDSDRVAFLRAEHAALMKSMPPEPAVAAAVTENIPVDQHIFLHGDHHSEGAKVDRTFPYVLAGENQEPPKSGSGRVELAHWLASPDNPLPARVMVNRIWQWHFGEALVRTPNNWGRTGDQPANPELLDYLAKRFVEGGWSVKAMHRMIMLSSAYQMSAEVSPEAKELDPANRLVSRFNRTRMSVEEIRDSVLALSGRIDLKLGGKVEMQAKGKKVEIDDLMRRTMYITVRRGSVPALLSNFDFGDATTAGEGRARTNVAPQALFVMNSRMVVERAGDFAKRLLDDSTLPDDKARIERAYLMAFTRRPDASEVDGALSYMASLAKKLPAEGSREAAWRSFCHVLLSTNEFLYLD